MNPLSIPGTTASSPGTLSYDTSNDVFLKKSRLWLDYAHNFTKWGDDAQNKAYEKLTGYGFKSKYQGTGARDVVALTWEGSEGDFSLMTEVMAGFNVIGMKAGAENVFGVTVMPSYKFTPHWEGVVRYQMAAGSNAVKWEKRYTQNSTYSGTSDCMQALYLGVNYYIFECAQTWPRSWRASNTPIPTARTPAGRKALPDGATISLSAPTSNCRTVSSRQQLAASVQGRPFLMAWRPAWQFPQKTAAVISVMPSIFKYLVLSKSEEACPISICNTCKFLKCLAK